jgi:chorismate synthase
MSKRSSRRRKGKSYSPRRPSASRSAAAARPEQAERPSEADLAVEYHYVVDDLKLIGLISAVLIAGLVILSFFL